jgi:hypothetical protein
MNLSISSGSQLFPDGGIKALGRVNAERLEIELENGVCTIPNS